MQIAVTAWKLGARDLADELAKQGETAEKLGFDSFWLPENHFVGSLAIPSPLLLLAAIASRTSSLRLGSTSYLLPIRNPILAAEEVAVLDRLSGGRVILGIGRGFQDAVFRTFGIPVGEKRQRFRENLLQMIDAWQGKPLDPGKGEPVTLAPLPVQQPHPPLWVAAFGPLAIRQAGSLGLPYIASPIEGIEGLAGNYAQHKQHLAEAGYGPADVTPVMRTVFVTSNTSLEKTVRDSLEKESLGRIRDTRLPLDDWAIVGDPPFVRDKIAEYRDRTGMNYLIARGRIQGIDGETQVRSHEQLIECVL